MYTEIFIAPYITIIFAPPMIAMLQSSRLEAVSHERLIGLASAQFIEPHLLSVVLYQTFCISEAPQPEPTLLFTMIVLA